MNTQLTPRDFFEKKGYVPMVDALPREECDRLTKHMFNLYKEGKLIKDTQCPLSDSVYGDPELDAVLEKFTTTIETHTGKKLIPQYTYARIYRPGEELTPHTDRPECEISATMCLGMNVKVPWPIYMANEQGRVDMTPGDIVIYKGCDLTHWRPPFKGAQDEWIVQVFLHYTDANGPYKNLRYDGRDSLGTQKFAPAETVQNHQNKFDVNTASNVVKPAGQEEQRNVMFANPIFGGVMIPRHTVDFPGYAYLDRNKFADLAFSDAECEKIIDISRKNYPMPASIGGGEGGNVNKEIRKADVYDVPLTPENAWIFEKIARSVSILNEDYFKFDILGITHSLQLLHYKYEPGAAQQGHYNWHQDVGPGPSAYRKISYVAMLSDPYKYTGGDLEIMDLAGVVKAPRDRGGVHMFPSYMNHQVTPLESGERYTLVIWVHGNSRFR